MMEENRAFESALSFGKSRLARAERGQFLPIENHEGRVVIVRENHFRFPSISARALVLVARIVSRLNDGRMNKSRTLSNERR